MIAELVVHKNDGCSGSCSTSEPSSCEAPDDDLGDIDLTSRMNGYLCHSRKEKLALSIFPVDSRTVDPVRENLVWVSLCYRIMQTEVSELQDMEVADSFFRTIVRVRLENPDLDFLLRIIWSYPNDPHIHSVICGSHHLVAHHPAKDTLMFFAEQIRNLKINR